MKRTSRSRYRIGVGVGIFLLLLIVLYGRTFFASSVWFVVRPFVAMHAPFSGVVAQMRNKALLATDNEWLRAELASTTAVLADRNVLYQENLELKARFGRNAAVRTILAGVIMRPPGSPYDTLMIDGGKDVGVVAGEYASAGGTSLIGVVDQVYATTARVVLFSSPTQVHNALLQETTTHALLPVVVEGQGGGSLKAEVPTQTMVLVGDSVVFPGIREGLVGIVSAVESKPGESFETLYLHFSANPLQLKYVEVWVP